MKRHLIIVTILLITIILSNCGQQDKNERVSQEFGNIPPALVDSLAKISSQIQAVEIDPTTDNTIIGKQGTLIIISEYSLVDENEQPITTKTKIQLKECYSITDIIASNLQTVHNGDILQTQGMIYLTATTSDGKIVRIDKTKPIRIEMPIASKIPDAKFFKGSREENGNINWTTVEEPSKKLIPFPITTIAPRHGFECLPNFGFTQDAKIWKDTTAKYYYTNDDITKYENTLLATREFKARYYSYCMSDLTNIYLANLDKNMWEIDELMVKYFIKDSSDRVNYQISHPPPILEGNTKPNAIQDSAYHWLINNAKEYGHRMINMFKAFASEKLTKIDETKKVDTTKVKDLNRAFIAYETIDFGWINCDVFFKDPKAEKVKLLVQINETPSIVNIIFRDRKIILDGIEDGQNRFRFTQNKEGYNKLPKGEAAIILAIGYRDNKIIFDAKEIIIGKNETEKLELQVLTADELKKRLNNYGG